MSFDALTIAGILSAALAGGFLLVLAFQNDALPASRRQVSHREAGA